MSKIKMCKIKTKTKESLREKAENMGLNMTDLIKKEFRQLLKENGLPTI